MKNLKLIALLFIFVGTFSTGIAQKAPQYYTVQLEILGTDYFNPSTGYMHCTFHYIGYTVTDVTPFLQAPNWYRFSDTQHSSGLQYITIYGMSSGYQILVYEVAPSGVLNIFTDGRWRDTIK